MLSLIRGEGFQPLADFVHGRLTLDSFFGDGFAHRLHAFASGSSLSNHDLDDFSSNPLAVHDSRVDSGVGGVKLSGSRLADLQAVVGPLLLLDLVNVVQSDRFGTIVLEFQLLFVLAQ